MTRPANPIQAMCAAPTQCKQISNQGLMDSPISASPMDRNARNEHCVPDALLESVRQEPIGNSTRLHRTDVANDAAGGIQVAAFF